MSDAFISRALTRDRWLVGGALALIALLAWTWLWRDSAAMAAMDPSMACMDMPDMDMSGLMACPDNAALYLWQAFEMWFLMMVAMMLPSAAPMILLYGTVARGPRAQGAALAPTAAFAGVYLALWGGFSLVAAVAQWVLIRLAVVSETSLALGPPRLAGALLVLAGLYQFSAAKRACLENCRSPLSFVTRLWRPGWRGALRLGLAHGLYCLGCCALLMALLFVFGVMNLVWVAALALLVAAEKMLPFGERIASVAGVFAIACGLAMGAGLFEA
jgi:predicted metal-binding membrane protein